MATCNFNNKAQGTFKYCNKN